LTENKLILGFGCELLLSHHADCRVNSEYLAHDHNLFSNGSSLIEVFNASELVVNAAEDCGIKEADLLEANQHAVGVMVLAEPVAQRLHSEQVEVESEHSVVIGVLQVCS